MKQTINTSEIMNTISNFKVVSFSKDEMRTLWSSNEVVYPNFVRVTVYYDGESDDASGNSDFVYSEFFWFASSFEAHKFVLNFIIGKVL